MENHTLHLKEKKWLLYNLEEQSKKIIIPKIPMFIETYHLTYMTLFWSLCVLALGYLSTVSVYSISFISIFIILQHITDVLDGTLGRYKNTGLVKWGFFMDHLLDYVFSISLVVSLMFYFHWELLSLVFLLEISFIFIVFISRSLINGKVNISWNNIGPSEVKLMLALFYVVIPFLDIDLFKNIYLLIVTCVFVFLIGYTFDTSAKIWKLDMDTKSKTDLN